MKIFDVFKILKLQTKVILGHCFVMIFRASCDEPMGAPSGEWYIIHAGTTVICERGSYYVVSPNAMHCFVFAMHMHSYI